LPIFSLESLCFFGDTPLLSPLLPLLRTQGTSEDQGKIYGEHPKARYFFSLLSAELSVLFSVWFFAGTR
jgi:hypothetical protein